MAEGNVFTGICHSVQGGGYIKHAPPPSSECTPPPLKWMHPPGQKTDSQQPVGTHPTGMHTCVCVCTWRKNSKSMMEYLNGNITKTNQQI